jgi:small subunit ribosomal protein S24e
LDLKIVEERKNPLLKRTEYRFEMSHPTAATPKRDEVRQELASQLKVPKDRVIIERMHAKFGTPMSIGEAATYASKDAALATVREHILIRNGLKEKAKPATPGAEPEAPSPTPAPAAPEPAAEKPAEKAPPEKKAEKPEKAEKPAEKSADAPADKPAKAPRAPKAEKAPAKGA